jgi:hypothetical protein
LKEPAKAQTKQGRLRRTPKRHPENKKALTVGETVRAQRAPINQEIYLLNSRVEKSGRKPSCCIN